jgi:hypothetical protein
MRPGWIRGESGRNYRTQELMSFEDLKKSLRVLNEGVDETLKNGEWSEKYGRGFSAVETYIDQHPNFHYSNVKDGELEEEEYRQLQYFFSTDYEVYTGKKELPEQRRRRLNNS